MCIEGRKYCTNCKSIDRIMGGIAAVSELNPMTDRAYEFGIYVHDLIEYGTKLYKQQGQYKCNLFAVWMIQHTDNGYISISAINYLQANGGNRSAHYFGVLISQAATHYKEWCDQYTDYGMIPLDKMLQMELDADKIIQSKYLYSIDRRV